MGFLDQYGVNTKYLGTYLPYLDNSHAEFLPHLIMIGIIAIYNPSSHPFHSIQPVIS